MIETRRFERIKNMVACKSYTKHQNALEKKSESFTDSNIYKTDKIDKYILTGCHSDENNKLLNFWSAKFINKQKEKKNFQDNGLIFSFQSKNSFFFLENLEREFISSIKLCILSFFYCFSIYVCG